MPKNPQIGATAPVAAWGAQIPVICNRAVVPPLVYAVELDDVDLVIGIAWGLGISGPVASIAPKINDADLPDTVTVTHYFGDPAQGVDPTLAAVIPGYADTLTTTVAGVTAGIAHSVFRVPPGAVQGFPRISAIIDAGSLTPAEVLAAYLRSPVFGPGKMVEQSSVDALASINNEQLDGEPRHSINWSFPSRLRLTTDICHHMPAPNSVFFWGGESYRIERA